MSTPLSLFGLTASSTVLPSAALLVPSTNGVDAHLTHTVTVGEQQGFVELVSAGNTTVTASAALGRPTGLGWCFDDPSNTLSNQQLLSGVWSEPGYIGASVTGLYGVLYSRLFLYRSGTYVPVGNPLQAVVNGVPTASLQVTPTNTLPAITVPLGTHLYLDLWFQIVYNTTGTTGAQLAYYPNNSTTAGYYDLYWTTPGYQAGSAPAPYAYGSQNLNDRSTTFLTSKNFDMPVITEPLAKPAYLEGMISASPTSWALTNEKTLKGSLLVVGASRTDLESKIDGVLQNLYARQQPLTLHSTDGRYMIADCTRADVTYQEGKAPNAATVALTFVAQQPFALDPVARSYSITPSWSNSGTTWTSQVITLDAGGTAFCRPLVTVTYNTTNFLVALNANLTSGTYYTSLPITSLPVAANVGDVWALSAGYYSRAYPGIQYVTISAYTAASGSAVNLPVLSFSAAESYALGDAVWYDNNLYDFILTQLTDGVACYDVATLQPSACPYSFPGDPVQDGAQAFTMSNNASNTPLSAPFPRLEPRTTTWQISCTYKQTTPAPPLSIAWQWTPRYVV